MTDAEFRKLALKNMGASISAGHTPDPSMFPPDDGGQRCDVGASKPGRTQHGKQAFASARNAVARPHKKQLLTHSK